MMRMGAIATATHIQHREGRESVWMRAPKGHELVFLYAGVAESGQVETAEDLFPRMFAMGWEPTADSELRERWDAWREGAEP